MGFMDTVFGEPDKPEFKIAPEYPEATEARRRLSEISKDPLRDIPLREIAPIPEMGSERTLARDTAKELIQPTDIFSLPEVQGIIQEVTAKGDLLANRIGRSLQKAGNFASTAGRDVLGRAVSSVQGTLAASLAPFAQNQRNLRANLIPVLEKLGLTEELRNLYLLTSDMALAAWMIPPNVPPTSLPAHTDS